MMSISRGWGGRGCQLIRMHRPLKILEFRGWGEGYQYLGGLDSGYQYPGGKESIITCRIERRLKILVTTGGESGYQYIVYEDEDREYQFQEMESQDISIQGMTRYLHARADR
jgi:hypothetical protein